MTHNWCDNMADFALPELHILTKIHCGPLSPIYKYLHIMFYFCAPRCTQTLITALLLFRRLIASGNKLRANILDDSADVFRFDLEYELDYEMVSYK